MFYRQKLLLGLLQALGGTQGRTDLQKILFLLSQKQAKPTFEFVPHFYGCFSWQSYADLRALTTRGLLANEDALKLIEPADYLSGLTVTDRKLVENLIAELDGLRGDDLIRSIYLQHPYYAIRSEIVDRVLTTSERQAVEATRPSQTETTLFTIGYEGRSLDGFVDTLLRANISVLCDVRKNAYSMKYGFSKAQLSKAIESAGIRYRHIPELGISSDKRKSLDSQADYDALFAGYETDTLPMRTEAVEDLIHEVESSRRVALMCF